MLIASSSITWAAAPEAQLRLALVIGISDYETAPLKNPVNDARAMSKALQASGFEVLLKENLTQQQFISALGEFGDRLRDKGGVGLFYYAGHGVQLKGINYLIPRDAKIDSEDEVRYRAIDANQVLEKMAEASNQFNLVILDACRDNPFSRSFRSKQTGLAQMDAPSGTLIAFATAPGAVAFDGTGVNGVYTKHLLRNLGIPGLPIELVLKRVREGVSKETGQKQIPWESSSLLGEFYFKQGATGETIGGADASVVEIAFWDSVKNSNIASEYQAYLEKYPRGQFAPLARSRLDTLLAQASVTTAAVGPPSRVAAAQPSGSARPTASVRVGDTWTYHLLTGGWFTRKVDALTVRITEVQGDLVTERLTMEGFRNFKLDRQFRMGFDPSAGMQEVELPGSYQLSEFSPYVAASGVPAPGKEWKDVEGKMMFAGISGPRTNSLKQAEATIVVRSVGEERVKVPAGEFSTVRVEAIAQSGLGYTKVHVTYWYSPQIRRVVKIKRQLVGQDREDGGTFVLANVLQQ